MLSYQIESGRSADRLARLLREQEVAGSNPVAPTISAMREASITTYRIPLLLLMLIIINGCTPSPKYRGSPSGGKVPEPVESIPRVGDLQLSFHYPVRGFSEKRITSKFGIRTHPEMKTNEFHQGIDIKAEYGDDVLASESGTVKFTGKQKGYGKVVIIDHGNRVCTVYAHLSKVSVRKGERVQRGMVIGLVGSSGKSSGTHLHFEIRIMSKAVDPMDYL
jgi:murein DD-endopeptidase MepM/ murein hydrolase activator NlpD